ncbi:hypothetical protein Halru_1226 [Halovivax ruber XH-70]|uniref:Luciferase n=1 Tax=Halovivax ruber (strain DSM 18193 / JCM 13892 / XH-70) TaxID=797302 RepID=L0ICA8_HALRX|nr:hypothetical protein [Halovivax ruber]AGB15841.1 hypothetical protein Halru_1226 [Halovivax ruber XH-70]
MLTENTTHGTDRCVERIGLDGLALKPTETAIEALESVPVETLTIDYEGTESLPSAEVLARLGSNTDVRVTTPVRADGFDPLGDDSLATALPDEVGRVLVAGHPAYLSAEERRRAVAPRLGAALETDPDAWVGSESIERIAMATGAGQFDLLTATTEREVRALRAAGFDGDVAVYAPTVLSDDEDILLDAVGDYVSRRPAVANALPADAPTDAAATGQARETLLAGIDDFALAGTVTAVSERIDRLRSIGVTTVVAYPARGLDTLLES